MPNINTKCVTTTTKFCQYGTPIIQICSAELWTQRIRIATVFTVIGLTIGYLTR